MYAYNWNGVGYVANPAQYQQSGYLSNQIPTSNLNYNHPNNQNYYNLTQHPSNPYPLNPPNYESTISNQSIYYPNSFPSNVPLIAQTNQERSHVNILNNDHLNERTSSQTHNVQEIDNNIDSVFSIEQKKCKRCNRFYKEDEENVKNCWYHPGTYRMVYSSAMGPVKFSSWSCCGGIDRDTKGCKQSTHLECKETTQNLREYTKFMGTQKPVVNNSISDDLIDLNFELRDPIKDKTIGDQKGLQQISKEDKIVDNFISHHVKFTDTLIGLSLKYQVSVDELKQINKIRSDQELWTRPNIQIPRRGDLVEEDLTDSEKARLQIDLRKRMIVRFRRITGSSSNEEAHYYLESSMWKFDDAVSDYNSDVKWQRSNPVPARISKKVY